MFLEILLSVMTFIGWIGLIAFAVGDLSRRLAVQKTLRWYKASTLRMAGMIIVVLCSLVRGPVYMALENHFGAACDVLLALLYGYFIWLSRNDDNWFNDQRKRLKKGWKKLKRRLAGTKLSPTRSPMPA